MGERISGRVASPPSHSGSAPSPSVSASGECPSRTAAPYSRDEIAALLDECRGWHDCLDGREAGDGAFTIRCENGESEQTRLNLRATLRDVATVLAGILSADPDWAPIETAPKDGRWVWGEWPEIVGAGRGGSMPRLVALMRWGQPGNDSQYLPHWCREGRWTPEEPARWAPVTLPPPASGIDVPKGPGPQGPAGGESPVLAEETPDPSSPDPSTDKEA